MRKIGDLRAALVQLLAEHRRDNTLPTNARFLFYELVTRTLGSPLSCCLGRRCSTLVISI